MLFIEIGCIIILSIILSILLFIIWDVYPIQKFTSRTMSARYLYEVIYTLFIENNILTNTKLAKIDPLIIDGVEIKDYDEIIIKTKNYKLIIKRNFDKCYVLKKLESIIEDAFSYYKPIRSLVVKEAIIYECKKDLEEMFSKVRRLRLKLENS